MKIITVLLIASVLVLGGCALTVTHTESLESLPVEETVKACEGSLLRDLRIPWSLRKYWCGKNNTEISRPKPKLKNLHTLEEKSSSDPLLVVSQSEKPKQYNFIKTVQTLKPVVTETIQPVEQPVVVTNQDTNLSSTIPEPLPKRDEFQDSLCPQHRSIRTKGTG